MRQEQGGLEHFFWIGFHRLLSHTCFQGNGNHSGSLLIFPLCSSRCLQTPVGFAHAEALFAERGCWSRELLVRFTRSSVVICPLLVILLQVLLGGRDRGMALSQHSDWHGAGTSRRQNESGPEGPHLPCSASRTVPRLSSQTHGRRSGSTSQALGQMCRDPCSYAFWCP